MSSFNPTKLGPLVGAIAGNSRLLAPGVLASLNIDFRVLFIELSVPYSSEFLQVFLVICFLFVFFLYYLVVSFSFLRSRCILYFANNVQVHYILLITNMNNFKLNYDNA